MYLLVPYYYEIIKVIIFRYSKNLLVFVTETYCALCKSETQSGDILINIFIIKKVSLENS